MANFLGATSLIGGATGALDKIDGDTLTDGDGCLVITATGYYLYILDDDSGAVESSPDVIAPDTNPGTKRWILQKSLSTHSDISTNDAATDVTGAELEELTDASETTLHSHAEGGTTDDHADISANDAATDVTGAELEELTDASETTLHSHAVTIAGATDYVTGNYNPTVITATSGNYTMAAANDTLAYTKMGRVVHLQGFLNITGENSPNGEIRISLPYAVADIAETAERGVGLVSLYNHGETIPNSIYAQYEAGFTYFRLQYVDDSGTTVTLTEANVDTAWGIFVNFTYIAA